MGIFVGIGILLALALLVVATSVLFGLLVVVALVVAAGYALSGLYVCYSWLLRRMHVRRVGNRARL